MRLRNVVKPEPKIAPSTQSAIRQIEEVKNLISPYAGGMWNLYRDGLTQSMIAKWLSCPERFKLSYFEGLQSIRDTTDALDFGNLMHDCLDAVYAGYKVSKMKDLFVHEIADYSEETVLAYNQIKAAQLTAEGTDIQELELHTSLAQMMLPRYFAHHSGDWANFKWIALEEVFDVECTLLGIPIRIRGKWDGIVEIDGRLWLFETKTKGRIVEENISDKLAIDLQVNLYLWAIWKVYGKMPAGVIYNVIRRPKEKLKKGETIYAYTERVEQKVEAEPGYYFHRFNGAILPIDLATWEKEFAQILGQIERWFNGTFHYKNPTSCTNEHGTCEFLKLCGANKVGFYKKRKNLFEELVITPLKDVL